MASVMMLGSSALVSAGLENNVKTLFTTQDQVSAIYNSHYLYYISLVHVLHGYGASLYNICVMQIINGILRKHFMHIETLKSRQS